MRTFVWVDAWQQQCCGAEFGVGSTVTWTVKSQPDGAEWVGLLLGREWAERVEYHEEHHDDAEETVSGRVVSIRVVTCSRVGEPQGAGTSYVPVPGSGRLREVDVADPWEPEPPESQRFEESFDGWIVEVELYAPAS